MAVSRFDTQKDNNTLLPRKQTEKLIGMYIAIGIVYTTTKIIINIEF